MTNIIDNLQKGINLTFEESKSLFSSLMDGKYDETEIIEILEALIKKGLAVPSKYITDAYAKNSNTNKTVDFILSSLK